MKFLIVFAAAVLGSGVSPQEPTTDATATPPLSPFTCLGRPPGYYADVHTGCRTYHVCDGVSHFTYICPRRTLFQQKTRICDHEYRVRCFREDTGQEEAFFLTDAEDSTYDTGYFEDDYDQTEEYIPTETTPYEAYKRTEIPTTFPTTPTPNFRTKPPTTAAASSKTTTTTAVTTTAEPTTVTLEDDGLFHKFLKFRVKDFRSLFFIPEFQNNSILAQPEKELVLPVDKGDLMIFKNRRGSRRSSSSSCPSYCNPNFFLRGTCHPCIMIK